MCNVKPTSRLLVGVLNTYLFKAVCVLMLVLYFIVQTAHVVIAILYIYIYIYIYLLGPYSMYSGAVEYARNQYKLVQFCIQQYVYIFNVSLYSTWG